MSSLHFILQDVSEKLWHRLQSDPTWPPQHRKLQPHWFWHSSWKKKNSDHRSNLQIEALQSRDLVQLLNVFQVVWTWDQKHTDSDSDMRLNVRLEVLIVLWMDLNAPPQNQFSSASFLPDGETTVSWTSYWQTVLMMLDLKLLWDGSKRPSWPSWPQISNELFHCGVCVCIRSCYNDQLRSIRRCYTEHVIHSFL